MVWRSWHVISPRLDHVGSKLPTLRLSTMVGMTSDRTITFNADHAATNETTTTSPLRPSYDVVVVGARAAGASTAMLLARRGLSVLAVDRGAYGSDTLSTHSLALAGVLQLSRWGVLDAIRGAGTPVTRRVDFGYGPERVVIDIPARGDVDGIYSPRRTVLDRVLVDAAVAAGADVRHGARVRTLLRAPGGRVNGVEIEIDGAILPVCARLVIGADGASSRVADDVGARVIGRAAQGAASIYTYFRGLPDDTIVNRYERAGVVGIIPTGGGDAVVWTGCNPEQLRAERGAGLDALHARLVRRAPDIAAMIDGATPTAGYRSFPGTPGFLREAWGDGWALVGDAGYFKDPVTAHGITDALIGAELVADATVDVLGGGQDASDAFGEYQAVRDEMAAAMLPASSMAAGLPGDMEVVKDAFKAMSAAMRDEWALIEHRWGVAVPA